MRDRREVGVYGSKIQRQPRESLVLFGFFIRFPQGLKTNYEECTHLI